VNKEKEKNQHTANIALITKENYQTFQNEANQNFQHYFLHALSPYTQGK
jgi:hypothetical protein